LILERFAAIVPIALIAALRMLHRVAGATILGSELFCSSPVKRSLPVPSSALDDFA
jgi:hypothetical protein